MMMGRIRIGLWLLVSLAALAGLVIALRLTGRAVQTETIF